MSRTKTLSSFFVLAILLVSLALLPNSVHAYSTNPLLIALPSQVGNIPETEQLFMHQSGKVIYYKGVSDGNIQIWIINTAHNIILNKTITDIGAGSNTRAIVCFDYDIDEVGFFLAKTSTWYAFRLNVVSYTYTQYTVAGNSFGSVQLSKVFNHNGDFYTIGIVKRVGVTNAYHVLLKFDGSALTKPIDSDKGETSASSNSWVSAFQEINVTNYIYYMYGLSDITLPLFAMCDIDGITITLLAAGGSSGRISNDKYFRFLGGGNYYVGNLIYMYFDYITPEVATSIRYMEVIQHRLVFNNSISVPNLLGQNERRYYMTVLAPTGAVPVWAWGYMQNKTDMRIITYAKSGSDEIVARWDFTIDDFLDYTVKTGFDPYSVKYVDDVDELAKYPYVDLSDYVYRVSTSEWQLNEYNNIGYLYWGLIPQQTDWDLTLTYSPSDSPLLTNKQYHFTVTSTLNDLPQQVILRLLQNSIPSKTMQTSSNGQLFFNPIFKTAQPIEYNIEIYYLNVKVYNETFNYIIIDNPQTSGIISPAFIGVGSTISLMLYLPLLLLILVPALLLSMILSKANLAIEGFMSGLMLGLGIAVSVGYPFYLLIIGGLVLSLFIFAKVSSR